MSQPSAAEPPAPSGFRAAQWRMLLAVMFCYVFYYTGRQTWGFVVPSLETDLGLSKTAAGTIAGALLAAYGLGQFINGNLGDRFGGRRLMTLGAILSALLVWLTSFGVSFWTLLIPWTLNGYAQSLGWAPGSRLLSNWFGPRERARAFGFYMVAAACSTILVFALCLVILRHTALGWPWVFRLPVLLLLLGGGVFYLVARDEPEELEYPSPHPPEIEPASRASDAERSLDRYLAALGNGRFMLACVALGFESMARYGLITWVPVYYLGADWKDEPGTAWVSLALPVGMALGALAGGYLSDKVFHANRSRPIILMMSVAAAVSLAIYFVPSQQRLLGVGLLFLAGFFVYGPQASFWALCPDLLGRHRAGTGVGVMDAVAYAFAAVQGPLFGYVIQTSGERSVFLAVAGVCGLGVLAILPVRR